MSVRAGLSGGLYARAPAGDWVWLGRGQHSLPLVGILFAGREGWDVFSGSVFRSLGITEHGWVPFSPPCPSVFFRSAWKYACLPRQVSSENFRIKEISFFFFLLCSIGFRVRWSVEVWKCPFSLLLLFFFFTNCLVLVLAFPLCSDFCFLPIAEARRAQAGWGPSGVSPLWCRRT